jgi:two-component system nitrate/nitrite response regulator NarL
MEKVKIIIADASMPSANGLRDLLQKVPGYTVVSVVGNGKELLDLLKDHPCDLVLMEVGMPVMDGIDTMRSIRELHPAIVVLTVTKLNAIEYINSMLVEGAKGYFLKSGRSEELLHAIQQVLRGEQYLSPAAQESVDKGYAYTSKDPSGAYVGLTPRERDVIRLIALERTNDEIAVHLSISTDTVKSHRKSLMTKLNVRSAAGLVKYAVDREWI